MSDALIADRLLGIRRSATIISLCDGDGEHIVVPGICDGDGVIRFYTPLGRWSRASAENGYAPLKILRQTSSEPAVFYYSMLDKNDSGHTASIWMPWGGDGPLRIVRDENDYHFLEITVPSPEGAVGGAVGLLQNRLSLMCRAMIPLDADLPEDPVSNSAMLGRRGECDYVPTWWEPIDEAESANTEPAAGLESYWLGAVIAGSSNTYVTMPNPGGADGVRGDMPKAKQAFTVYGATHKYDRTQNSFSSTVKSNLALLRKFGWGAKLTGIVRAPLDLVEDAAIEQPFGGDEMSWNESLATKQYWALPAFVFGHDVYMLVAFDHKKFRRKGPEWMRTNLTWWWNGGASAMLRDDTVDKAVFESAFTDQDGEATYTCHPGGVTIHARLKTAPSLWHTHACIVSLYNGGLTLNREDRF